MCAHREEGHLSVIEDVIEGLYQSVEFTENSIV